MLRRRASMGMGLLGAALAASVGGCTDDAVSLSVVCAVNGEDENGRCRFEPDIERCNSGGVYNLLNPGGYSFRLVLQSGLRQRQSDVPVRAETNALNVTDIVVTLRNPNGKKLKFSGFPNPFTVKTAGYVPVEGLGITRVPAIPPIYLKQLQGAYRADKPLLQVLVGLEIRAVAQGQQQVSVATWEYPVDLVEISTVYGEGCEEPPDEGRFCDDRDFYTCVCTMADPCGAE